MFSRKLVIIAVAAVGVSLIAMACSDDDDTGSAQEGVNEANTQLCTDLATLETSLTNLAGVNSSTTVDDATAMADTARDDYNNVVSSANALGEARVDTLESAQSAFRNAVDDLPDGTTLEDGAAAVSDQADVYRVATAQLFSQLDCSG